jgi:magnesium-transporting ATPase (P-type)
MNDNILKHARDMVDRYRCVHKCLTYSTISSFYTISMYFLFFGKPRSKLIQSLQNWHISMLYMPYQWFSVLDISMRSQLFLISSYKFTVVQKMNFIFYNGNIWSWLYTMWAKYIVCAYDFKHELSYYIICCNIVKLNLECLNFDV